MKVRQFSKCRTTNKNIMLSRKYLSDSITKELNESFGVLYKKESKVEDEVRNNNYGIVQLADKLSEKVQDYIEKYSTNGSINVNIPLLFLRSEHAISWLENLRVNLFIKDSIIYSNGSVSPENFKIESNGRVSVKIELNLNPENSEYEAPGLFAHEMMHVFQMWNWKGFYGNEANETTYQKYTTDEELEPLKKEYPNLLKGIDYNNLKVNFSNNIPIHIQLAYCICRIGYYLNPLEMQAYLQESYTDLARLFELSNANTIKEISNRLIKTITKHLDYPLMFLEKYKSICLENNLFDDPNNLDMDRMVSSLVPIAIQKVFRISPESKTLFQTLNKVFIRRFSYFRDKVSRMHLIFQKEVKNFEELLRSTKVVLYQENNRTNLVKLPDMLYSKKFLPVYENYAGYYQMLKEEGNKEREYVKRILKNIPSPTFVDEDRPWDGKIRFY